MTDITSTYQDASRINNRLKIEEANPFLTESRSKMAAANKDLKTSDRGLKSSRFIFLLTVKRQDLCSGQSSERRVRALLAHVYQTVQSIRPLPSFFDRGAQGIPTCLPTLPT